ncbi:GntR family transcriptional regulator [Alloyangia pacifica]|uniref:GntR family transcriptional regulator n=1 Tax=Roseobacteraceae TaxID=2854170 RepID=UPI000D59A1AF|nr:GntR family transcriptional regulator [Alloyangia pacifica]NDV52231.1 FadR family transcriptional regulator [Salipiger sp. PrR003]NDW31853.1 FadR family transcriptional regulator [Salipiger sp. PrR007]
MPERPSFADQFYKHLLTRNTDGTCELRIRLPNEESLTQEFGVSRPVVRAALAWLRTKGIVQSRRGSVAATS